MCKTPPTDLQGEGNIGEVASRVSLQVFGKIHSRGFESRSSLRRENQKLKSTRRTGACFDRWSFFYNNVCVRSTDTEGTHACATWRPIRLPFGQLRVDEKWRAGKINIRIRQREIKARRQVLMLECEHGFNQAGNAGGCIRVSDVRFNRTDGAVVPGLS